MRTPITCCLVLLAAPATALADPSPCEVTILRAPETVRSAIEQWVHAEPHCATTAEVRAVTTDGGYYLFAIDGAGRTHERVVPDAQSAGVLVASWIADDGAAPPTPPVRVAVVTPPREPIAPPSETIAAAAPAPAPRDRGMAIAVGVAAPMENWYPWSLHGELDLVRRGHWVLGADLDAARTDGYDPVSQAPTTDDLFGAELDGRYVAGSGPWTLRLSLGIGAGFNYSPDLPSTLWTNVDTSIEVARDLGAGWGVAGGPVAVDNLKQIPTLILFAGLRHSL